MKSLRHLLPTVLILLGGLENVFGQTNLQINCGNGAFQTNPTNCALTNDASTNPGAVAPYGRFPTFQWSGSSSNWRLQVDSSSNFHPSSCPWFWDSGVQTTPPPIRFPGGAPGEGSLGTCAGQNLQHTNQQLWFGARKFYWRVSFDGGTTWSPTATFSYENYPNAPASLSVASGSGGGAFKNFGVTSTHATYYVGGTGASNTPSCGATGTPCGTIGYAIGLTAGRTPPTAPGDLFLLRTGTYNETLDITGTMPDGTESQPITIKRDIGAIPTITGTIFLRKAYWTLDGITSANPSAQAIKYDASNLIVKNCTITGNGSSVDADASVVNIGKNAAGRVVSNYFVNNTITSSCGSPCVQVEHHGGADLVIRGNDISGGSSHGIHKTGDQAGQGNLIIADNYIHDLTGANGGGMGNYYGTGKMYIARNFLKNIQGGISSEVTRGAEAEYRNNTINTFTSNNTNCYKFADSDGQITVDGDVCYDNSYVFSFSGGSGADWQTQYKVLWNNSTWFHNTRTGSDTVTDGSGPCAGDLAGSLCITQTNITHADPLLDNTTGKPSSSSTNVIDLGSALAAVPMGGSTRVDRGRFEFNAANIAANGVYDYQPRWTGVSATPRISWTFSDADNIYNSAGQTQSAYEAQIDTVNTFDSKGDWKPLCSSGKVLSSNAFWDVPTSCGLISGVKYYFRVRTWDNINTAATAVGMWSDYVNSFTVSGTPDTTAPAAPTGLKVLQ